MADLCVEATMGAVLYLSSAEEEEERRWERQESEESKAMGALPGPTSRWLVRANAPTWVHIAASAGWKAWKPELVAPLALFLPYQLVPTVLPNGTRCVINRALKALGKTSWTSYEQSSGWHIGQVRFQEVRPLLLDDHGHLFNEDCPPWARVRDLRRYRRILLALIKPWNPGVSGDSR